MPSCLPQWVQLFFKPTFADKLQIPAPLLFSIRPCFLNRVVVVTRHLTSLPHLRSHLELLASNGHRRQKIGVNYDSLTRRNKDMSASIEGIWNDKGRIQWNDLGTITETVKQPSKCLGYPDLQVIFFAGVGRKIRRQKNTSREKPWIPNSEFTFNTLHVKADSVLERILF